MPLPSVNYTPPGDRLKVIPALLLATRERRPLLGGAIRAYLVARWLDAGGSGGVDAVLLRKCLIALGVGRRTARRWLDDSMKADLLRLSNGRYWYPRLSIAAHLLGVKDLGKPVMVKAESLCRKGWRSLAWAGCLAALPAVKEKRPISRRALKKISNVSARSQARHEGKTGVQRFKNYVDRGPILSQDSAGAIHCQDAAGWREAYLLTVFAAGGRLIQRLPDSRSVPGQLTKCAASGRSRKANKELRSWSIEGPEHSNSRKRLFFTDAKGQRAALRATSRSDNETFETFLLCGPGKLPGREWAVS